MRPLTSTEQTMMTYKGEARMRAGVASMQRQGWVVTSTTSYTPRSGCLRFIMLGGIGTLVFHPQERFTVTYSRPA